MKKTLTILPFLFIAAIAFAQQVRDLRKGQKIPVAQPKPVASINYEVIFYENPNYNGRFELVKPTSSGANNHSMSNFNDMVSSVQVPNGMVAILYEHANEKGGYGNYVELMEDCADLSVYGLNDKVSFVAVFPATMSGSNFKRTKNMNGSIVPGHWERARADGKKPDNSPPGLVQYKAPVTAPIKPVVDETLPVFRIQLRLVTGNGENEDTDKEVYVKFNTPDQEYFLDYGPDDFERGADKKYEIISSRVRRISDIDFIEIGTRGDDVWGVKKVELYINNSSSPVFSKTFTSSQRINGTGNWQRKIVFTHDVLRQNPYWQTIATDEKIKKPQPLITADVIKTMVESMLGNMLHHKGQGKVAWGDTKYINTVWGDHVEMKRKDGNTLSFDLDLQANITGQNPEVDVDFDLEFDCTASGYISIKTANVKTSCDFDFKIIQPSCETIRSVINGALEWFGLDFLKIGDFNTQANTFSAMFFIGGGDFKCKGVQVTPKNDVIIY